MRSMRTGINPGPRGLALALVTSALVSAACSSADLTEPRNANLHPGSLSADVTPSISKVQLFPDSGFDKKAWTVTIGQPAYFHATAYDAQGKAIPASSVKPIFKSF